MLVNCVQDKIEDNFSLKSFMMNPAVRLIRTINHYPTYLTVVRRYFQTGITKSTVIEYKKVSWVDWSFGFSCLYGIFTNYF